MGLQDGRFVHLMGTEMEDVPYTAHHSVPSAVQWSLYVPPYLVLRSAHTVYLLFMCFVWISEQTAIISLYNIN
jgi:hypothetical protein